MARRCSPTSSSARSPFIANIRPPSRSNGSDHLANFSSDATARDVTASISPTCRRTSRSSARPRTTATSRPRSSTTSWRNSARRKQRLDEDHPGGRTGERQRDAGQPSSTADVRHRLIVPHEFGHRGTVEHVSLPQPRHLRRPKDSPFDTGAGEDGGIALGQIQPRTKDSGGRRWWIRSFAMFHVKHPPDPPSGRR